MRQYPSIWAEQYRFNNVEQSYGLPRGVLEAIVAIESSGNSEASNGASVGLFQIERPAAADAHRVNPSRVPENFDRHDVTLSAEAAATYLQHSMQQNNGSIAVGIAGYRAGPHNRYIDSFNYGSANRGQAAWARAAGEDYLPKVVAYLWLSGERASAEQIIRDMRLHADSEVYGRFVEKTESFYTTYRNRNDFQFSNPLSISELGEALNINAAQARLPVEPEASAESPASSGFDLIAFLGSVMTAIFGNPQAEASTPAPTPLHASPSENGYLNLLSRQAPDGQLMQEVLNRENNRDAVRAIQRALGNIAVDGVVGNQTMQAFQVYDADHDNIMDVRELRMLFATRNGDAPVRSA